MKLFRLPFFALLLLHLHFGLKAQEIAWTQIEPGVWKGVFGAPEAYDLLKVSGAKPNHESLSK